MKAFKLPYSYIYVYLIAFIMLLDSCKCNELKDPPRPLCNESNSEYINGKCECKNGFEEINGNCFRVQRDDSNTFYYKSILKNGNCADDVILGIFCDTNIVFADTNLKRRNGATMIFYNLPDDSIKFTSASSSWVKIRFKSNVFEVWSLGLYGPILEDVSCFPKGTNMISLSGYFNRSMDTLRAHTLLRNMNDMQTILSEYDQVYVKY